MRDVGLLDQLQSECFIVEFNSVDSSRGSPGPNHQMVEHCKEKFEYQTGFRKANSYTQFILAIELIAMFYCIVYPENIH